MAQAGKNAGGKQTPPRRFKKPLPTLGQAHGSGESEDPGLKYLKKLSDAAVNHVRKI